MNQLSIDKKVVALSMLTEGNSIRSIERVTGVHRDTIIRLMLSTSELVKNIMDDKLQNLTCDYIQCDEIWSFVAKKQKNCSKSEKRKGNVGDQYIFVALDPKTKLVPHYFVGKRDLTSTYEFLSVLKEKINSRFQLSTDSLSTYRNVVDELFGANIDYAQITKIYGEDFKTERRYSPMRIIRINKQWIQGQPKFDSVSTSHVERQNLTMRMNMRRLTRLTNAFSKKLENLIASCDLHFFHYNFMRIHKTLQVTPAMEHGVSKSIWSWEDVLGFSNLKQKVA